MDVCAGCASGSLDQCSASMSFRVQCHTDLENSAPPRASKEPAQTEYVLKLNLHFSSVNNVDDGVGLLRLSHSNHIFITSNLTRARCPMNSVHCQLWHCGLGAGLLSSLAHTPLVGSACSEFLSISPLFSHTLASLARVRRSGPGWWAQV